MISDFDARSTSPGGRYIVGVRSFEARAFQWVDTPEIVDTVAGVTLLDSADCYWHLDSATWQSESVVSCNCVTSFTRTTTAARSTSTAGGAAPALTEPNHTCLNNSTTSSTRPTRTA